MKFWICKISIVLLMSSCAFGANKVWSSNETVGSNTTTGENVYTNAHRDTATINQGVKVIFQVPFVNYGTFENYGEAEITGTFYNYNKTATFYGDAKATSFNNSATFNIYGATLTGNFSQTATGSRTPSLNFAIRNGKMGNIVGNFGNSGGSVSVNVANMALDTRYTIISGSTISGLDSSNIGYTGTITADGYRFYYENGQVWLGKESDPSNPSPSGPNTPTPPPSKHLI